MKVVLQRVSQASCTIDNTIKSQIGPGYCLLVGFGPNDTIQILDKMARKIVKLRLFSDDNGKMNKSILDIHGEILSISQFTLYADWKKGNRPGFSLAAKPDLATKLYDQFNQMLAELVPVQTGEFGADMKIALVNDGPVTLEMEMEE